jgi:hypothetical protein
MSAVEEIKAAAAKLDPDEQAELFRWWVESDVFKQRQLAALKRDLALGIEQLDHGRYQSYDDATDFIRLNALHLKITAKVQRKKK